ncbi:cohesin domain-containing protein [Methanolobus sp.]|uniref:cohesin domain-containing protein n=1 Tax=Methanolobus sp. TaxID=1874737 RepID=UPI0025F15623|nr:cohesin domain-containing protein [Methanolobus sp.]
MRLYLIKNITKVTIFLLLLVFGCFNSTAANVTLKPSTQIVTPSEDFTVDVFITPDSAIAGLQFNLEFDSSKIQVHDVSKGRFLSSKGASTFVSYGNIDNNAGILSDIYGVVLGPSSILEPESFKHLRT